MKHLEWPTLGHRRKIQRLMFKVVRGLVAVPSTQLTSADLRTRANHQFKYRNILTSSTPFCLVPSGHGTSYHQPKRSTLQHSTRSRVALPYTPYTLPRPLVHRHDIPMGVCQKKKNGDVTRSLGGGFHERTQWFRSVTNPGVDAAPQGAVTVVMDACVA